MHGMNIVCVYTCLQYLVVVVVVYLMSTLSPLQVEKIFWDRLFHLCILHESNAWRKRCVFRPDLKTGKEQGDVVHRVSWTVVCMSSIYWCWPHSNNFALLSVCVSSYGWCCQNSMLHCMCVYMCPVLCWCYPHINYCLHCCAKHTVNCIVCLCVYMCPAYADVVHAISCTVHVCVCPGHWHWWLRLKTELLFTPSQLMLLLIPSQTRSGLSIISSWKHPR